MTASTQHLINQEDFYKFAFGGNCILTFKSLKTEKHFTYKITVPNSRKNTLNKFFSVYVLSGADNTSNYIYIGKINTATLLFEPYTIGKNKQGESVKGFEFVCSRLAKRNVFINFLEIYRSTKCCRCGRLLTTPESIESGFGPECINLQAKNNYIIEETPIATSQPTKYGAWTFDTLEGETQVMC